MTMSEYWKSRNEKRNDIDLNIDDNHCYRCGDKFSIWNGEHYHNPNLNCNFCLNCGDKLKRLFKAAKQIKHGPMYYILRHIEMEDGVMKQHNRLKK